jgi:hypothetical protein
MPKKSRSVKGRRGVNLRKSKKNIKRGGAGWVPESTTVYYNNNCKEHGACGYIYIPGHPNVNFNHNFIGEGINRKCTNCHCKIGIKPDKRQRQSLAREPSS